MYLEFSQRVKNMIKVMKSTIKIQKKYGKYLCNFLFLIFLLPAMPETLKYPKDDVASCVFLKGALSTF